MSVISYLEVWENFDEDGEDGQYCVGAGGDAIAVTCCETAISRKTANLFAAAPAMRELLNSALIRDDIADSELGLEILGLLNRLELLDRIKTFSNR